MSTVLVVTENIMEQIKNGLQNLGSKSKGRRDLSDRSDLLSVLIYMEDSNSIRGSCPSCANMIVAALLLFPYTCI